METQLPHVGRIDLLRRRDMLAALGGAMVALPWPALAQRRAVPMLGFLGFGAAAASEDRVAAMRTGLRDAGYVEGKTIGIEFRWAETIGQLNEFAAELVRLNVDVIFAQSSTETAAARRATKTIPIVFATHADPIGVGHIVGLARPGGNITGLTVVQSDLTIKALEILKEVVPRAARFGILWSPTAPSYRPTLDAAKKAGDLLRVDTHFVSMQQAADIEPAFKSMAEKRVDAFFVSASTLSRVQRVLLAAMALKHRLPSMFGAKDNVDAGGLLSYAPDANDLTRRAATYIDKILKGARPADIPVEQASKYHLAVNLKTAKALGLSISETVLLRADAVIE